MSFGRGMAAISRPLLLPLSFYRLPMGRSAFGFAVWAPLDRWFSRLGAGSSAHRSSFDIYAICIIGSNFIVWLSRKRVNSAEFNSDHTQPQAEEFQILGATQGVVWVQSSQAQES